MKKKHLTLTGLYAGLTFCGASRDGSREDGIHAAYTTDEFLKSDEVCLECLHIWADEEN